MATYLTQTLAIDESKRQLIIDTPGNGTYGIYKAPVVDRPHEWQVYLETNGDPVILPHSDYPDELAAVLADAEVTQDDFEAALGMEWRNWCT